MLRAGQLEVGRWWEIELGELVGHTAWRQSWSVARWLSRGIGFPRHDVDW